MIFSRWPAEFRVRYGGTWPADYLCFDTETSGLDKSADLVLEIGHCLVRGGVPVERDTYVVNWYESGVSPAWLDDRIGYTADKMHELGKAYRFSPEVLRAEGVAPRELFEWYGDLFSRHTLASHNGWRFDVPMLQHSFERADLPALVVGEDQMLDTDSLERFHQAADRPDAAPRAGETLRAYFQRSWGLKYKSSLDRHCFAKYALDRHMDPEARHSAAGDAYCVHLLIEAWRTAAETAPSAPVPSFAATVQPTSKTVPGIPPRSGARDYREQRRL